MLQMIITFHNVKSIDDSRLKNYNKLTSHLPYLGLWDYLQISNDLGENNSNNNKRITKFAAKMALSIAGGKGSSDRWAISSLI